MSRGQTLDYMVLTPAGVPDASLAIAGSRAGALGVLNLEFATDPAASLAALASLTNLGRGRTGVLLDGEAEGWLDAALSHPPASLEVIVLTCSAPEHLSHLVETIHASGRLAYLVVTDLDQARIGQEAGADALIAKGHEAGGWVGEETAFVLLQRLVRQVHLPIWLEGGIGLHTAAACYVAGAAGVVLNNQLLLARESPLPEPAKTRIGAMDGSETMCFGAALGSSFRAYSRPNLPPVDALRRFEASALIEDQSPAQSLQDWRAFMRERVSWDEPEESVLAIGQDAAFAADLARRFVTVGGILAGMRQAVHDHITGAQRGDLLAEGAPLAQSHRTRYPIVQGPMTRVSDRAEFASAVAGEGALPFLALALMREPELSALLDETRRQLRDRPWGVGILGFVSPDLRAEQLNVIRSFRPPFALIAGGRPDQARVLENDGIPAYLHLPSPGLLQMYLKEGARRFVFEGRECGGHVGPRTSFVLWDTMIRVLLAELPAGAKADEYHVLFAGGVHDGLSAAMVAAMAAPLAERGVRVGVLLGTAYLFTEEAVRCGAITPGFQHAALACERTVLLETGPGHATRCVPSPYTDDFVGEKRRLAQSRLPAAEIRDRLEALNIGRLRIASKGLDRDSRFGHDPTAPKLATIDVDEQWTRGMYMIGQVAALGDRTRTLAELHASVSDGGTQHLAALTLPSPEVEPPVPPTAAVAIVGIGCILPGAPDLPTFWANILNKVDAVTEVPASRWDWRQYYDPDRAARDKVYSRWGGFIDDVPFDPVAYGMPPNSLPSIEPFQLLGLAVVRAALEDAGYLERPFARERTSVILGAGGGGADLSSDYVVRSSLPELFGESASELVDRLDGTLPEWTEDSFPGVLMNIAAGRIANRFDFGGVNHTVDAACASSLAAIYHAVRDLESGTSDVIVAGGVDALQNPFMYLCFSKTQALSPSGRCRPFDADADGIAISEGFAALVLKRLADAERDGDHIYAVIRGVGGASDGRDRSLTAPQPEGQMRALRRAYAQARYSPATVSLIEAHGTGTVAGDKAEVEALSMFFAQSGAALQRCAIGSVKSMIGHTKATAGVAGLIKVALALQHRVLPPTLGVSMPNPKANFPASPFYVNTESRPWIQDAEGQPRRAGVSAFGFGGTNFHVALEEYTGSFQPEPGTVLDPWPAELLIWRRQSRTELLNGISDLVGSLERGARPRLADLAYTLALQVSTIEAGQPTLAIVAGSLSELIDKLHAAQALLRGDADREHSPQGIHYAGKPLASVGKVAFLFPGQGSQHVNMARDLAVTFPEVRACFDRADRILSGCFEQPLSRYIFPPPVFTPEEEKSQGTALTETNIAQPALGVTSLALCQLLRALAIEPQMTAGHSYGEFVALATAGCLSAASLLRLSEARGRFIREGAGEESGTMAAIDAAPEALQPLLIDPDLTLANLNAPLQTVISGTRASVERAIAWCTDRGFRAHPLPVACAFHSPLVAPAQRRLAELLRETPIMRPRIPVYSNTTAAVYPEDSAEIAELLSEHLVRPVAFVREIEAMYAAGARVFVEVGPRAVLSGLTGRILGDQPHLCVSLDQPGRPGLAQLLHALAALVAEGVPLHAERLFRDRTARRIALDALDREIVQPNLTPTTWLINGGRARPAGEMETTPVPLRVVVIDGPAANGRSTAGANGLQPTAENHRSKEQIIQPVSIHPPRQARDGVPTGAMDAPRERARPLGASNGVHDRGQTDEVMARFQQVMQQFLETQKTVMLAYLGNRGMPTGLPAAEPAIQLPRSDGRKPAALQPAVPPSKQPEPPLATNGNGVHGGNGTKEPMPYQSPAAPPAPARNGPVNGSGSDHVASAAAPGRRGIADTLLSIVSERTGYPTEMLALDADLEADLGIDSIKRVEIAGTVLRSLPLPEDASADIEKLAASRTLGQIIETLEALLTPAPVAMTRSGPTNGITREDDGRPFEDAPAGAGIGRYLLHTLPAPPVDQSAGLATTGVVVILDDEHGVGEQVAAQLARRGQRTVRIVSEAAATGEPGVVVADLSRPEAVAGLVDQVHSRFGQVNALIHLASLRAGASETGLEIDRWQARLDQDLTALFLLAQALRPDLEKAAGAGGAAVLAATALGGAFAVDRPAQPFFPGHGGIVGLLKTLAQEWPTVRVKAVDIGSGQPEAIAGWLLAELFAADDLVEVGYRDGQRTRLGLVPASCSTVPVGASIDRNSVVLVTGGARGITAEAALQIAETYQPTLLLVGRTPVPEGPESSHTANLTEPRDIKQALIEQHRQTGQPVTPARIEDAYRRLLQDREVRRNLARIRQTGARVTYLPCDVRDPVAFGALIGEIYCIHGRIDGVIHGAGIIEDKLIRDKQLDSFERVLTTKLNSALVLANTLRPETLRFLVFFSSVSGRFGNTGQGDYAAASEILNKLAVWLDQRWSAHVVSINWGPWLKTGMVSPEVQRQFAERGVSLIPVEIGCRRLDDELCSGRKGEVEVVIAGLPGDGMMTMPVAAPESRPEIRNGASSKASKPLPLLAASWHAFSSDGGLEVARRLDPAYDLYLNDHRIDARPVFPFAMAMELMAEVAAMGWPELEVREIREIRLLRGITIDGDGPTVRATARPRPGPEANNHSGINLDLSISSADDSRLLHYRAVVELGTQLDPPAPVEPWSLDEAGTLPMSLADAYREWLFQGPLMQGINSVEAIGPAGAGATLRLSSPQACLKGNPAGDWLIDPVMVDSALQMQILWARIHWDLTLLPADARGYRRYAPLRAVSMASAESGRDRIRYELRIRPESQSPLCHADHYFYSADGRLLGMFMGMVAAGSRSLNRLAGANRG